VTRKRSRRPPSRKPPAAAGWKGKGSSSGSAPRASSGAAQAKRASSPKAAPAPSASTISSTPAEGSKRPGLITRLAVSAQTVGMGGSKRRGDEAPAKAGTDGRDRAPAEAPAFPPAGVSLARGLTAVGRSPGVLALTFLIVFLIWAVIQSLGVSLAALPSYLSQVGGLPPFSSFLLVQLLQAGLRLRGWIAAVAGTGIVLARAVVLATWAVTLVARLRRDAPEVVADDQPAERVSVGDVLRVLPGVVAFEVGFLLVALVGYTIIPGLGPGIGQLGLIALLVATMYFFIFIPFVLVTEGGDLRTAVRASIRAARLPGSRHLLFTTGFLMLSIFLSLATPGSIVAVATPSLAVWVYVLFASFVYATVFGAYAFRWLMVRDRVMQELAARAATNGSGGRPTSRTGGGGSRRGS
jgi:hypothetical protein